MNINIDCLDIYFRRWFHPKMTLGQTRQTPEPWVNVLSHWERRIDGEIMMVPSRVRLGSSKTQLVVALWKDFALGLFLREWNTRRTGRKILWKLVWRDESEAGETGWVYPGQETSVTKYDTGAVVRWSFVELFIRQKHSLVRVKKGNSWWTFMVNRPHWRR